MRWPLCFKLWSEVGSTEAQFPFLQAAGLGTKALLSSFLI